MLSDFDPFQSRHIGPDAIEREAMLKVVGASSLDALMGEAIPARIRLKSRWASGRRKRTPVPRAISARIAARNQVFKSFIGLGYYDMHHAERHPAERAREPGLVHAYTPYQAEIAQGRLEALLNFQTMVRDLTGMEIANASLLDEATAAAEAMTMLHRVQAKRVDERVGPPQFLVADSCYPQTLDLLARAPSRSVSRSS